MRQWLLKIANLPEDYYERSQSAFAAQHRAKPKLSLPSGNQIGTITPDSSQPSPRTGQNPAASPALLPPPPAVVSKGPVPPTPDRPNLPTLSPQAEATITTGVGILAASNGGLSAALKGAQAAGKVAGIYNDVADGYNTLNDIAQHKGTVTIAHDVENDMWDIINTAALRKAPPGVSIAVGIMEKKGTAAAEDYLSNLLYENFYKPKN